MNAYTLPTAVTVNGTEYPIRTDYRDVLNVINALNDPDLDDYEKTYVFFAAMFPEPVPPENQRAAQEAAYEFINAGYGGDGNAPHLMDWEQDAPLIVSAVNKVAGKEIRAESYLHWWTFLGYYMEIGESQFSNVVNIRQKKKNHQKLEKYEQEFYRHNKSLVDLKEKISEEDLKALDELVGWRD